MANETFSLLVLDQEFMPIYPISKFSAFIWVTSYYEAGEVQLELPWEPETYANLKVGYYLYLRGETELGVIETIGLTFDAADKSLRKIVVKGKTLSYLLARRIIWDSWGSDEEQDLQEMILGLVDTQIVNPSDENRKISFFKTKVNEEFPSIMVTYSGKGENLYETVQETCETELVGFKATFDNVANEVEFSLYKGVDRSYDQEENPPVIFSSSFENIGATRYALDTTEYKSIALVVGGNDGGSSAEMVVGFMDVTGVERREMYIKSSETSQALIESEAKEKLAKVNQLQTVDAEFDANKQFKYGKDFFVGDIVQLVTDFGLDAKALITNFCRSWSEDGYEEIPTFRVLEE